MAQLITFNELKEIVDISDNINVPKKVDPQIKLAQEFDLMPFLGDKFYYEILFNATDERFLKLIGGVEEYEYEGFKYSFEGLKHALAWYAYARIASSSKVQSTATGMKMQVSANGDPVDEKTLARLISQAQSVGYGFLEKVRVYLDRYPDIYPNWKGSKDCSSTKHKSGAASRLTPLFGRRNG